MEQKEKGIQSWLDDKISIKTKQNYFYKGTLKYFSSEMKMLIIYDFLTKNEFCINVSDILEFQHHVSEVKK